MSFATKGGDSRRRNYMKVSLLALALSGAVATMIPAEQAYAQSTTGSIYGAVPAGSSIEITSDTGLTRVVQADANGRYSIGSLPVGQYTVTLRRGDEVVDIRKGVQLRVGQGVDVSFSSGGPTTLASVTVVGSMVSPVDVTSVDSRTVITAEQLAKLPLARSAESIAMLAPGAVKGSAEFGNVVSFGGAGVSENAYYINGFATGHPLSNIGGVGLPYGAIDQQETYTGGYSARYGRSDGGVINQVGKRGTNEWKFGGQVVFRPRDLANSPKDVYYPNEQLPEGWDYQDPDKAGALYRRRGGDKTQSLVYSAYAGGPLIKDKLFVFAAAEQEQVDQISTGSTAAAIQQRTHYDYDTPKLYAKLDWNISDDHILELTGIKHNDRQSGYYNAYDYETGTEGERLPSAPDTTKDNSRYYIAKYTGYLSDNLTFSATYGKSEHDNLQFNLGEGGSLPYLNGVTNQNPAYTGGTPIRNAQGAIYGKAMDAGNKTRGLRADLEWVLGDHQLTFGIDNMYYSAHNEGQSTSGPGYLWIYSRTANPNAAINPSLGVGAPGQEYYVQKYIYSEATSMSLEQKAYFIEDRWYLTDDVMLSLGIRNDKFTNKNSAGEAYVDSGDQWAPRLGVSWDVFGDSSLKVYGNLGRYYLALPNQVAIRAASASIYTREYFTYSGIDANGVPTGLSPLGPGPVSANNEYGQPIDPATVTAKDLKSQYQDEAIIGFDKTLGDNWVYGAKAVYRRLGTAIDDICDPDKIVAKLEKMGYDADTVTFNDSCPIFNPGLTNTFVAIDADGNYFDYTMTAADWGLDKKAKRNYAAVNLYLERAFNDKWQARIDYTWSRSTGNTEGQVKSDIGQDSVSKTQDWDAAALMWYAGGYMANDRRHQLKAYGAYQFTPEWLVSANLRVMSGAPRSCLGYYTVGGIPADSEAADPVGYGGYYHACGGKPSRPGDAGRTPWTTNLDLGVSYRPAFAGNKLAFGLQVFNALNQRKPTLQYSEWESSPYTVDNTYGMGISFTTPRYTQLSVSYDY